jgi:hypothetical protein
MKSRPPIMSREDTRPAQVAFRGSIHPKPHKSPPFRISRPTSLSGPHQTAQTHLAGKDPPASVKILPLTSTRFETRPSSPINVSIY